ncbi:LLM class flavin-dependent oxidoreductase [Acidisoma silvae]|uniref:LLM class flavin-dependent oxidoreductase n=1 Tax=Acidisoma silvae TaxID=2802396 RepID=A0A963YSV7_9PROT|nr:LLM class flavin-dependent oxidoreductase [Acidisoma silvae]MCB8876396.1 LLM class flavin-dependent oxidoreductase [Acidisoma silvae]
MQLGIYSFGETAVDPATGRAPDAGQRLRDLVAEIELADQVGLDVFGVGEHHRPDYAVSSPAVVLAAAASRTRRIKLTTAVTVLSSDDPVRVFQDFATLDQLSEGRAEITAGRGSFIESFPLFGYDLDDYDTLFQEKLDLLLRLRDEERITWAGRHRPALDDQPIFPRPFQNKLPIWVAIGGTPASAARAARLGLPMAVAIIGGEPARFAPLLDYYRDQAIRAGRDPATLPISINSHGFVGETTEEAAEDFFLPLKSVMDRLGAERGWPPMGRAEYDRQRGPSGALLVGSPEQVAEKILFQHTIFRHQRFLLQVSVGPMPHAKIMKAIELFGTRVAPIVRAEVARRGY